MNKKQTIHEMARIRYLITFCILIGLGNTYCHEKHYNSNSKVHNSSKDSTKYRSDSTYKKGLEMLDKGYIKEAYSLMKKAALMNNADALSNLGCILIKGDGPFDKDTIQGLSYLLLADSLHNSNAETCLAYYFYDH